MRQGIGISFDRYVRADTNLADEGASDLLTGYAVARYDPLANHLTEPLNGFGSDARRTSIQLLSQQLDGRGQTLDLSPPLFDPPSDIGIAT